MSAFDEFMQQLRSSPMLAERIVVSGHVLDLQTGLLETVLPADAPLERAMD